MIDAVSRAAPAKINLALHVTGRREDGYHLIESLVVFTEFGDRVTVAAAELDGLSVDGPFASSVPMDESNLVLRARNLLRASYPGASGQAVRIALEKNLPAASGIGGGSSDAAATLKALAEFWDIEVSQAELARLALPLGADLPMCLAARPLVAKGIGDDISPVEGLPPLAMVLVNPGVPVSTPEVFGRLASRDNPPIAALAPEPDLAALLTWLEANRNDLEAPARLVAPAVSDALGSIRAEGARFARMSGSGATCFGIFETAAQADAAAARIAAERRSWFVVASTSTASEEGSHGRN